MIDLNSVDKSREALRELQIMIFDDAVNNKELFEKTIEIDNLLNSASVDYNKYLNSIEKINDN